MQTINFLYDLSNEVKQLETKYKSALNYIYALRSEKAAILTALNRGDERSIEVAKQLFINKDFEQQKSNLLDFNQIETDLMNYQFNG